MSHFIHMEKQFIQFIYLEHIIWGFFHFLGNLNHLGNLGNPLAFRAWCRVSEV